jgi:hypothetical protein
MIWTLRNREDFLASTGEKKNGCSANSLSLHTLSYPGAISGFNAEQEIKVNKRKIKIIFVGHHCLQKITL